MWHLTYSWAGTGRLGTDWATSCWTAVFTPFYNCIRYATFRNIFHAHAQKRLFRSFRSKIWPCHSCRRPRLPITLVYFHYWMTFVPYIWCFCAQFSCHLVSTFDLLTLAYTSNAHTNFSILRLSVPLLWVTQSDHISSSKTVTAHAQYHMTCA